MGSCCLQARQTELVGYGVYIASATVLEPGPHFNHESFHWPEGSKTRFHPLARRLFFECCHLGYESPDHLLPADSQYMLFVPSVDSVGRALRGRSRAA